MKLEIDTRTFYNVGVYCFLIIGIFNTLNYVNNILVLNFFSKISGLAGIIFNFALVLFFNYLRNMTPIEETVAESDDIEEIIKEIKKGKLKGK